jgi:hypothetical protein
MREQAPSEEKSFFVRLRTPWRTVTAIRVPQEWVTFRDPDDNLPDQRRSFAVDRIPKDASKDFVLARATLPDGSELDVGRATNNRQAFVEPFLRTTVIVGVAVVLSSCRRRLACPSRHAPGPANRGNRALDHSNR